MSEFTGAQLDTLIALVESGPLWDGDVPSKAGRDDLIVSGLAVRVIYKGEDGFTSATYQGRDAYNARYGGSTINESMANRKAGLLIRNVKYKSQP